MLHVSMELRPSEFGEGEGLSVTLVISNLNLCESDSFTSFEHSYIVELRSLSVADWSVTTQPIYQKRGFHLLLSSVSEYYSFFRNLQIEPAVCWTSRSICKLRKTWKTN